MKKYHLIYILLFSFIIANDVDVLNLKNGDLIKGRIVENKINEYIRIELQGGSVLTYSYDEIESIEREEATTSSSKSDAKNTQVSTNTAQSGNCYLDGQYSGDKVSGGGAMVGGFGGGLLGGLIGWGIAYLMVSGGNPQPEYYEMESLDGSCKSEYAAGYKKSVLKTKKGNVNLGGAMGTVLITLIALGG